jgi:phosphoribosyl 1,2-cyclic phosphate phosphodiesterase
MVGGMKITVLGSGTSTGVPMVGCSCAVCRSDDPRDRRSRCSILIQHDGRHILVDTSTDLRHQALRENIPRIDAVLYTHCHADHVNGIDDLRGFNFIHRQLIPCYGDPATMAAITRIFSYIFTGEEAGGYRPLLEPHPVSAPFDLFGLTVVPVPLEHGSGVSTGYRLGPFAYLTDCSAIPASSLPLLRGVDTLLLDALRHTPHPNHFTVAQALEVVDLIAPRRAVLTHLTHEIRHRDGEGLPAGVEFAWDGMVLEPEHGCKMPLQGL